MTTIPADAPSWAQALFAELHALRQRLDGTTAPAAPAQAMMSARACDKTYRLRAGTARAAYEAGLIRGQPRAGKSATGQVLWLRADDAERLWGAK